MEQILITVSLLVSNRKDTIRKCMESIKPLLDAVPSELIAVDTVGEENSDGSLDIVREYTDKIVHFEWCNDFAAARNAGLERARGKWFLYLDDDEWFEDITPIIKFFTEGDYKNYDRAWYYVRNYHDFSGTNYLDTLVDRISKITKESKFEGRVHECLLPYPTKVMQFFCYVHHYGYAYKNDKEREKHTERNSKLLELELEANPENARMVAQLVQEYAVVERYEDATKFCKDWLSRNEHQRSNPFTQYVVVMWLRMTMELGDWDASAELLKNIEARYALKEAPHLACMVEGIRIASERKQYDEVLGRTKEYFELKRRIEKGIPDLAVQQILDLTKYTEEEEKEKVMLHAISAVIETRQFDMADELFGMVRWSNEKKKPFAFMVQLIEFYGKSGRSDIFFKYAEQIRNNPRMKSPFMVSLDGLVRDYPERRGAVMEWLNPGIVQVQKKINPEMEQLAKQLKQNIRSLLEMGQTDTARELLQGLKELVPEDAELAVLEEALYNK